MTMKIGLGLYRESLTPDNFRFARQAGATHIVAHLTNYFRGRAAYHLYPHNVEFDPRENTVPPANALRPGDFVVVYQRRGIQFNADEKKLRFEGGAPISAEAILVEPGAALFRIM